MTKPHLQAHVEALRAVHELDPSHPGDWPAIASSLRARAQRRRGRRTAVLVALLGLPLGATAYAATFGQPAFVQDWLGTIVDALESARPTLTHQGSVAVPTPPTVYGPQAPAEPPPLPQSTESMAPLLSAVEEPQPAAPRASDAGVPPAGLRIPGRIRPDGAEPASRGRQAPRPVSRKRTRRPRVAGSEAGDGRSVQKTGETAYARAHRLHFVQRDCERAVVAWDDYLSIKAAILAPEARYNRAICLVRLDRREAALQALQAIADGTGGAYRQREARALLRRLSRQPASLELPNRANRSSSTSTGPRRGHSDSVHR